MGDIAGYAALITAIGGLAIAVLDNRRLRLEHRATRRDRRDEGATALRIKEIEAVQEFRDTLRQTVKDQADTIHKLGEELEANRLERIQFERERLDFYKEREERERLQERVEVLETSLGEARRREQQLAATLQSERESWDIQRDGFEARIRSLELVLKAAGVDVPREREATG